MTMRVGLVLPMASTDAGRVLSFARRAEELGFDGVFAFDHLFPPGAPPDRPSLEAYVTLAAVAAVTERLTLGTLVTRASLRHPGVLAKLVVGLDDIAAGRFVLGIGTGDAISRAEHVAFGLPYLGPEVRRDHLVEVVRAVKALFRGVPWPGGDHVPAIDGPVLPPPVTRGGPPVWLGGTADASVRAAAREAEGWNGWGLDPDAFAERVNVLRREARDRGVEATWGGAAVVGSDRDEAERLARARRERGITGDAFVGDVREAVSWLGRFAAAGASWAIVLAGGAADRMELIGERVLPALRERSPA
jgi:alkanesulfonate monooxygenase SsuD/methylene tetrahydromethanopterin reductase-like flavin-dependent oxidoreductase (luciferase family)